jgi:hypothetical protein
VQAEVVPFERNYFRTARGLEEALRALDDRWRKARRAAPATLEDTVKTREAGSGTMPRPLVNEEPMTGAERQALYRAARTAGAPVVRMRRPADRHSRIQRWNDTIAAAVELQAEYAGWLDALPDNLQDSALANALRTIVELDLSELQAVEPPRGFGRD